MNFLKVSAITLATVLAFSVGSMAKPQPHMQGALQALQNAKQQLEKAIHDKGGHRVKAIELINQAISEVKQGIAAGN